MATARRAKEIPDLWHHFLYVLWQRLSCNTPKLKFTDRHQMTEDTAQNSVSWKSRWCTKDTSNWSFYGSNIKDCQGLLLLLHWHYSPLWALVRWTMSFHCFLSATNSLHLLTPSTWRSLSTSSFHLFLGLPLLLVPSSSWVKIFLGILSSSILSRWPNQLIICHFIHFTTFCPLLISSSSRFVRLFHSPFSYLGAHILLNIFL